MSVNAALQYVKGNVTRRSFDGIFPKGYLLQILLTLKRP